MVSWEVSIGRINSCSTRFPKGTVSLWLYTAMKELSKNIGSIRLHLEYKLELRRLKKHPKKVSRLTGVFLFETYHMAEKTLRLWNKKEKIDYISEINFFSKNYCKVDSDWITNCLNKNVNDDWMDSYWEGKAYSDNPHWEIIAEGDGIILNKELRQNAYKNIYNNQGFSTPILAFAICAYSYNYYKYKDICKIVPYFYINDNKLKGAYIIENDILKNNQKDITNIVKKCMDNKEFPSIKFRKSENFANLINLENEFFEIELDDDIKNYFYNAGIKL